MIKWVLSNSRVKTVFKCTSPHRCKRCSLGLQCLPHGFSWKILTTFKFSSVTQLWLTLCDPTDCNTPGFPVHHQLLEPTLTHVHHISDAIQSSQPLSSPSPPAFNLFQHQNLFQWVGSLHQVAKVLAFQLQHQSFQWIFRTDFLLDWLVSSPYSPLDSRESKSLLQHRSSKASILRCSAFFMVQLSHPYMTTGKP